MLTIRGSSSAGLVVRAIILIATLACSSDPGHNGRSSKEWINDLHTGDTRAKVQAAGALREVLEIRPEYPAVVQALVIALRDTSDEVRIAAASALTAEGVDSRAAIDGLHAVMHDSAHADVRASVLLIIGTLSPDRAIALLPYLCEVLEDREPRVRAAAVSAIGAMGSAAAAEIPSIAKMSRDSSPEVREAVLKALVDLEADVPLLLAISRSALSDSSAEVRTSAALTLRSLGPPAAPALNELTKAIWDGDQAVSRSAVIAIAAIGPPARSALPALRKLDSSASGDFQSLIRETMLVLEGRSDPRGYSPEPTNGERCRYSASDPRC
jgi:HEAT repeat protein